MRLIDADKADVNFINTYYSDHCRTDDVQEWLDEQPTIDAEPVKRGEWIVLARFFDDEQCSRCPFCQEEYTYKIGKLQHINAEYAKYNYCPNCGAKMDGGKET